MEEGGGTGKGQEERKEEEDEVKEREKTKQRNEDEAHSPCSDLEDEMRRLGDKLEAARARFATADKARQDADARLADVVATEKERQRVRERQRRRATEGLDVIEAGTEIVGRSRYNNAYESASVAGGVKEKEWDVVASLDRRVASLEEWRDNTEADQETTREQHLAETDALLRFAGDAREVATVFAGRWKPERGGGRYEGGDLPR